MSGWWNDFGAEIAGMLIGTALKIIVPWAISAILGIPVPIFPPY